ncbi:hypothetical protein GOODEAATRI_031422 [Goodea atripinnis]|uniref:Uncharacterized protein n=1 Tax=Goodea atripinnis TaxID=208336 RepID=A0ABV0PT91_9TELE
MMHVPMFVTVVISCEKVTCGSVDITSLWACLSCEQRCYSAILTLLLHTEVFFFSTPSTHTPYTLHFCNQRALRSSWKPENKDAIDSGLTGIKTEEDVVNILNSFIQTISLIYLYVCV